MAFALNLHHHHALPPVRSLKRPAISTPISDDLRLRSRKCLFGPTDPTDTMQMVKENLSAERTRFFDRFGVHIEDLEQLAIDEDEYRRLKSLGYLTAQPSTVKAECGTKSRSRKLSRRKRVLKPYNADQQQQQPNQHQQMRMTDYCQVKKSPTMDGFPAKCPPPAPSHSEPQ